MIDPARRWTKEREALSSSQRRQVHFRGPQAATGRSGTLFPLDRPAPRGPAVAAPTPLHGRRLATPLQQFTHAGQDASTPLGIPDPTSLSRVSIDRLTIVL